MSKLREKFDDFTYYNPFGNSSENIVEREENNIACEKITKDFGVKFAEWLLWQDITSRGKGNFVCADGVQRTTAELQQIFIDNHYE